MTNNKEIIGYKAPYNINAIVLKGTIYTKCDSENYCPKDKHHQGSEWYLPPQIVETWEPIYKEEPIPEYVECTGKLNAVEVGKIYPVNKVGHVIHDNMLTYPYAAKGGNFKPSTKEAYDLQNQPKFEVGKWYKDNTSTNLYIKYKAEYNNNGFISSEKIIGTYHSYRDFDFWSYRHRDFVLLTDLSEIQQFLPDGHPDKIVKEFVLPELWYIEVNRENLESINKFRLTTEHTRPLTYSDFNWYYGTTRIGYIQGGSPSNFNNAVKITLEQFKKYVLKEVDWTKATKEELLAEAKRRYPEGVLVKSALSQHPNYKKYVFTDEIKQYDNSGDIGTNFITLYSKSENKWAEIIEQPKSVESAKVTEELVWKTTKLGRLIKVPELSKEHLVNIITCLNGVGHTTIPNPYNGKSTSKWRSIMQEEYKKRYIKPVSTKLFSKEQLDAINLMIDKKVKELE